MRRWTEYCQGERLPGMLLASTSAHARVGSTGRAIRALYQGTRRRTLDLVTQIPAHGVCALLVHMGVWHRVWTGTSAAAASVGPSEASAAIALECPLQLVAADRSCSCHEIRISTTPVTTAPGIARRRREKHDPSVPDVEIKCTGTMRLEPKGMSRLHEAMRHNGIPIRSARTADGWLDGKRLECEWSSYSSSCEAGGRFCRIGVLSAWKLG